MFYNSFVPPGTIYVDCNTENVICLITCKTIYWQYVGETVLKLNFRFNWHRTELQHSEQYNQYHILTENFNEGVVKFASYSVQILKKNEDIERTER